MSLRTRVAHLCNITVDDAYRAYVIVRDAARGLLWLRNWWKARSALDRWTMRVAAAHTLIGGLPGVLLGLFAASALTGSEGVPPSTSPYYLYYQTVFLIIIAFVVVLYYAAVRLFAWNRLEGPLRLEMPNDVVEHIIRQAS